MKANCFFTGTASTPPLSLEQLAELARRTDYCARRLAREMGLTRRTLERRFQKQMGCAPGEWLAQRRMADAETLLQSQVSLKVVSTMLAYRDLSGFYREFRRRLDCTPGEYQARHITLPSGAPTTTATIQLSQTDNILSQTDNARRLPATRVT
ncbi:MAG TPA: helix-turn-helix transcriptional regulator [Candidatus Limnocylindria bacterium]|nr:helix-turn-helix transcriptional regulator [Candidatus Limnocylindria bacterium]